MTRIALYAAASDLHDKQIISETEKLIRNLARENFSFIYGGANVGLMKKIADIALEEKAHIIGVLAEVIEAKESAHPGISEMILTKTMQERKNYMAQKADAFIALPGGSGTLDEIFEVITYNQIGLQNKETIFFNSNGYYDGLKFFIDQALKKGAISPKDHQAIHFTNDPQKIIKLLKK